MDPWHITGRVLSKFQSLINVRLKEVKKLEDLGEESI